MLRASIGRRNRRARGVAARRRPSEDESKRCLEGTVFEADDIRKWRDHDVVDSASRKIGTLESIYVDTATDKPAFTTITVGMPTRRRLVFVPLDGAKVGPGYLKVTYPKNLVREAPSMGTDDVLPATEEEAVFKHYELSYQPGAGGERRLARP
jgi:hypothetical protein